MHLRKNKKLYLQLLMNEHITFISYSYHVKMTQYIMFILICADKILKTCHNKSILLF